MQIAVAVTGRIFRRLQSQIRQASDHRLKNVFSRFISVIPGSILVMKLTDRRLRTLFYILWPSTLALQCWLVGLSGDEAYYWRYSRDLAWGYFDHPPVTAALVRAGYFLIGNELGVRFFFIVASTALIAGLEKLIRPADVKLFYAIVLSIAFLQLGMVFGGGMMAIPDIPLLFFELVFFFLYQRYLRSSEWWNVLFLAAAISLMLLTKYHGILVVGFTVLSNLRLLTKGSFWLIVVLSVAFLIPHVLWQTEHGFPSAQYHLFERSVEPYSFKFTAEYLAGQPFVLGPFVGVLLVFAGIVFKPRDEFEKSLKYVAIGTYLFFLVMTLKGRVEANWTIITLVPLVYLGYKHIESRPRLRSFVIGSFFVSAALILMFRILISVQPPLPRPEKFMTSLKPWEWCEELQQKTNGLPAVFVNSYQKASLYEFYTGVPSFSLNNIWGRKNQFTTWDTEASFQGKDVAWILNWGTATTDSIRIMGETFPYGAITNFRSTSNLRIKSDLPAQVHTRPGASLTTNLQFYYTNKNTRDLEANGDMPTVVTFAFFQGKNSVLIDNTALTLKNSDVGTTASLPVTLYVPSNPGRFRLYFAATTGHLAPGLNSAPIEIVVEE